MSTGPERNGFTMLDTSVEERLNRILDEQPYPLLFATISGAHLYGFPSHNSDYDLRGVHVLPVSAIVDLQRDKARETVTSNSVVEDLELDVVTHDVAKFFRLLLKRNGYVLEQLYSPLVVRGTHEHSELRRIALGCITRHHSYHYLGFAATQWKLFASGDPPRIKPLLYAYRVLLTGIHMMRTGRVEANLPRLNEEFRLPYIDDLVARKVAGSEKEELEKADVAAHLPEYERLRAQLEEASLASKLPEAPTCQAALNDLLVEVRLSRGRT
jgi:predicted nucleotidyltransferase